MTDRPKLVQTHPVNIQATEMMGKIFDALKASGYGSSRQVEYFLTRLVFCLFADDTGIFGDYGKFQKYIEENTEKDGSDLGTYLLRLFHILNQHNKKRSKLLDPKTRSFSYINGALFSEQIEFLEFNEKLRQDDLNEEFNKIDETLDNSRQNKFLKFQNKLSKLTFFDPACGSGNFLAITYREIRRIEHRVIMKIYGYEGERIDTDELSKVDVHQFYGIEINPFSSKIAEVSLWMMDHLMNLELTARFGWKFRRIPIQKQPHIHCRDTLEVNWNEILDSSKCSYLLGNPPYTGSKVQTKEQREQVKRITDLGKGEGTLDYVSGWLIKAAEYVDEKIPMGFVTTNSITQGEQVGQLWPILLNEYSLKINFAYDDFKWKSESRGEAGVGVVILGMSKKEQKEKNFL